MIAYKDSDTGNIILKKHVMYPDGETSSESLWYHSPRLSRVKNWETFLYSEPKRFEGEK
jgi:hypothetical protein